MGKPERQEPLGERALGRARSEQSGR
jgi:hypothetical protein